MLLIPTLGLDYVVTSPFHIPHDLLGEKGKPKKLRRPSFLHLSCFRKENLPHAKYELYKPSDSLEREPFENQREGKS